MAIYSDIIIDQGSDFETEIEVSDAMDVAANLTGYTVTGQMRKTYTSSTATDFVTSITAPLHGKVKIALTATTTNGLKAGRYVYDVEVTHTASGVVTRIVEGQAEVTPGVTQ